MIDQILELLNNDLDSALYMIDKLELGSYRGMFRDLDKKLINDSISRDECRNKLKRLLICWSDEHVNHSHKNESIDIFRELLKHDFVEQKDELLKNEGKKSYYVFLQGTPNCGLHYLIMHRHENITPKVIKANQLAFGDSKEDIWAEIVNMLDLTIDVRNTQQDIPTKIASRIEPQLKEKPIVIILHSLELWGNEYLQNLKKLIGFLNKIIIEESENSLYWYFIHKDNPNLMTDDDLIVLPPVEKIAEREVRNIYLSNENLFRHCPASIYPLFQSPKNLSDIIDIFLEHSSCRDQLRQHFNKLQLT